MASPLLLLVDAAIKSVPLLLVALALSRGLGRAPATARQAVWAIALAGCVLIPVFSPWLPTVEIGRLPLPVFLEAQPSPTETPPARTPPAARRTLPPTSSTAPAVKPAPRRPGWDPGRRYAWRSPAPPSRGIVTSTRVPRARVSKLSAPPWACTTLTAKGMPRPVP